MYIIRFIKINLVVVLELELKWFEPVIVRLSDYHPGGMVMPDRNFSNENYRFGFNGKPKDDEINGSGDSYDYGYRIYDPRIARFLSVDPLSKGYPFYSPYQFAGNTPIAAVDVDGLEPTTIIDKNGNLTKPIIGFLQGAIDIQRRVSESTLWMEGSRSAVWKLSGKPTADTWGNTVFFDPSLQSNMDEHFWAQLVGHEQTHRMQIDKIGWIPFASAYYKEYKENKKKGLDDYDAYRRISYEAEAYAQEAKLADFFSDPGNTKGFDFIIHNALLTDQEKSEELEIEGIEKVAIPAIENTMQDVQTVMSETKNRTKKAYLEGLYDQLGKDLQSKKNRAATLKQQLNGSK
ncbi:MAG: RHS repeat-associated core domain-containing protein [Chitinophagaceae bacterium]|nr:RHS repeat-associated core domain-containing protein [Chitinophagaceae bacterium]